MWRVERSNDKGEWQTLMAGPHRLTIDDVRGPPGPAMGPGTTNGLMMARVCSGDLFGAVPTPGNRTMFSGHRGWQARVRYNDIVAELYDWAQIPDNEFVPEDEMVLRWGWKLREQHHVDVPFEELWPMSFLG